MKLTFLGTRGEIEARTAAHRRHTSLLVEYRRRRVMIDAGQDWLGHLAEVRPQAIVLTHAHPDHAWGLAHGAPCPVYACAETWARLHEREYPVERRTLRPRLPTPILGVIFEAFPVEHSLRAPAVGYRVTAGRVTIFYVPDVVYIPERAEALRGCALYVGDGATLTRPMVRRQGERLFGHTPVRTELGWCAAEGVPRAIITHCGSEIVTADPRAIRARLARLATDRGIEATLAHDGLQLVLR